jgi:hypothetical protein
MKSLFSRILLATIVSLVLIPMTVHDVEAASDDEWNYSLSPVFLWGMKINGSSTVGPSTLPLEIPFSDVLSNLDSVFTVHFEAQKNDLTLFSELQYVDLEPETKIGPVKLDVDFKDVMFELGAAYRLGGDEATDWEVLGGARYFDQELEVDLGNTGKKIEADDDWWNGFIGGRVKHQMSDAWVFEARADYGQGSSSNYSTNAIFYFDYTFNDWGSAFVGYKYMKIKYNNDRSGLNYYAYEAEQQGPVAGLNIHF